MKYASSIVRILCGVVLLIVAASRYFSVRRQLAESDGAEVQIFGYAATAEPWQFTLAFAAAITIGLVLTGIGGYSLMKKVQEG